jgi:hypothetical protein
VTSIEESGGSISRVTITAIQSSGDRTTLSGCDRNRPMRVVIPSRVDVGAARRWLGSVRRIDRVEITVGRTCTEARARGRRHRLPFAAVIPLAAALGLTELGIPTILVGGGD